MATQVAVNTNPVARRRRHLTTDDATDADQSCHTDHLFLVGYTPPVSRGVKPRLIR